MNSDEQQDPVWQLLAKARKPEVRPDFLRNVLGAVGGETQASSGETAAPSQPSQKIAVFPRRLWLGLGGLAAAAAIVWGTLTIFAPPSTNPEEVVSRPAGLNPAANPNSNSTAGSTAAGEEVTPDDSLEQELVAVDGFNSLIEVDDPGKLNDAELLALLN